MSTMQASPQLSPQDFASQTVTQDAMGRLGHGALTAFGLGAAGRGLLGLYQMLKRKRDDEEEPPRSLILQLPVAPKTAQATTPMDTWWFPPAMVGTGVAAGLGGYKLLDYILDKRRKSQLKTELDQSRSEFNEAMLDQYNGMPKTAAERAGQELNKLYEIVAPELEKRGTNLLGLYLAAYGLPTLAAGGYLGYQAARSRSQKAVLEAAARKRQTERYQNTPAEIFAVPTPVGSKPLDQDDLDQEAAA